MAKRKSKFNNQVGKKFRSKFEEKTWHLLKENNIPFQYEPKTWTVLEGFDFTCLEKIGNKMGTSRKTRPIRYTPDFVGKDWIMETKGKRTDAFNIRWKLFKKYMLDEQLPFALFMPGNLKEVKFIIDLIKNGDYAQYIIGT